MSRAKKAPALCPRDEARACLPRTRDGRCIWCQRELPAGYMGALRAEEAKAEPPKRGRGRPRLDPGGSVELRVRVTQEQAVKLDRLCRERGIIDVREEPIRAALVRLAIEGL